MTTEKTRGRWARTLRWAGLLGTAAVLAACGGGGGGSAAADGSLRVALTDAPSCGFDHVYVTVEKVSVHQSASAGESDAGWTDITVSPAKRIDLLSLTNGALEELGTAPLAAGHYSQVRLVLSRNTGNGASSLLNAIQPTGGSEVGLATPSAQQSGLKLQAHFDVASGQMADLVLDFDACKSIVKSGNGSYSLKPVIAVVPRIISGIQGYVSTTLTMGSTTVAAQQDGVTIRSTTPDSTGKFSIPYLSTGTFTLVVMSEGHATAVVTGVPTATSTTVVNGTATAILPPVSAMADITGTVTQTTVSGSSTVSAVLTDATARALQTLTGGPTIELANRPVDGTAGTYLFHLPVGAPVKAAYVSSGAMSFQPDTAVAGKYSVQVQSPGLTSQTKPADISASSATVNFNFGP